MTKNPIGICSICGQCKELTFEHIPPKHAYNRRGKFKVISFIDWDVKELVWKTKKTEQRLGAHTLCRKCNGIGSRYVGEYKRWVDVALAFLQTRNSPLWHARFANVSPLMFLKAVMTMFCSVAGPDFVDAHQDIRRFVMDKKYQNIPPEIRVFMYLNTSNVITRAGITGIIDYSVQPTRNYVTSEFNYCPFGFVLYIDPVKYDRPVEITWFKEYEYDKKYNIVFDVPVLERNTPWPGDYRTEIELSIDRTINQINLLMSNKK